VDNEAQVLGSIIGFSIGLAGFSGVIIVFANHRRKSPVEKYRIINLLLASFIPGFTGFAAMAISQYVADVGSRWQMSCLILALCYLTFLLVMVVGRYRLSIEQQAFIHTRLWLLIVTIIAAAGLALFMAAYGVFEQHTFGIFYLGSIFLLLIGVIQFVIAVLADPAE
jgi:hypothetical protein